MHDDFEWDPKKAETNAKKHGVHFSDATGVFEDPNALTIEEQDFDGEERRITVGMDCLGRLVVVVYVYRGSRIRRSPHARPTNMKGRNMNADEYEVRDHYDFTKARRGRVVPPAPGKVRITIRLDDDILEWFRSKVESAGGGNYQTMINNALRQYIESHDGVLEATLRRVVREELKLCRQGNES
jgi:uncharacterized DUF497 family protein